MAFLDNSGDILLDAVLTDTGRYRLAKGDGSFKIAKFALGDDEIDYSLYNSSNPSGSAYYDLDILQTPILEALTDNASALKSHLLTINQTDLLFLPVLKLYNTANGTRTYNDEGYYLVAANSGSEQLYKQPLEGVFFSLNPGNTSNNNIVLHQGLDTPKIGPGQPLSAELVETMYMIEMDNRLGVLLNPIDRNELNRSYVDDDQMATYLVSLQKNKDMVSPIGTDVDQDSSIRGPRGTWLKFKIAATLELQTNDFLFDELGTEEGSEKRIDSMVRVTGLTTGYRLDIPVRYVKTVD